MEFVVTRTEYCIEVPVDLFIKLDDLESSREFHQSGAEDLGSALEKLDGVDSVEYNGHYGAAIHLRIDAEDDNEETRAKIKATIKKHLKPETCGTCKHDGDSTLQHCKESGCLDGVGDGWEAK